MACWNKTRRRTTGTPASAAMADAGRSKLYSSMACDARFSPADARRLALRWDLSRHGGGLGDAVVLEFAIEGTGPDLEQLGRFFAVSSGQLERIENVHFLNICHT